MEKSEENKDADVSVLRVKEVQVYSSVSFYS